jgi:hypothetical protein
MFGKCSDQRVIRLKAMAGMEEQQILAFATDEYFHLLARDDFSLGKGRDEHRTKPRFWQLTQFDAAVLPRFLVPPRLTSHGLHYVIHSA